jgi:hypothetical protein
MLTGPPRVNDILFPYPQYAGGGDGRIVWEPDHLYFDGREGRVIRQTRYYGVYNFGYNALSTKDYRKVVAALDLEDPVRLTLTRAKGDPEDVSETELRCALESVVPVSGSGDKAPGVYSLEIKLRTLEWRATRDGVSAQVLYHGFDFSQDTDLMGGVQVTSQQPQAWRTSLPYPKRLAKLEVVEAGDVTVRFYDASNQQIGSDRTETLDAGGNMYLELPEGVREVEVETSGSRPSLYLDEDTFVLTLSEKKDGSYDLRAFGRGSFALVETITRTDRTGTTRTLGYRYQVEPAALGRQRIGRTDTGGDTLITHDT